MHSAAEIALSKFHGQQTRRLAALDQAHDSYYREETFGGPSLYFHLKSLETSRAQNFDLFAEYAYAMLPAWGMHRMCGGAEMRDFDEFHSSLQRIWPIALQLQEKAPGESSLRRSERLKGHLLFNSVHGERHLAGWEFQSHRALASKAYSACGPAINTQVFVQKHGDH